MLITVLAWSAKGAHTCADEVRLYRAPADAVHIIVAVGIGNASGRSCPCSGVPQQQGTIIPNTGELLRAARLEADVLDVFPVSLHHQSMITGCVNAALYSYQCCT